MIKNRSGRYSISKKKSRQEMLQKQSIRKRAENTGFCEATTSTPEIKTKANSK